MALAWQFVRGDRHEAALAARALGELPAAGALVPALWYAEMANGLLRGERAGLLTQAQISFFLHGLSEARIENDSESPQASQGMAMTLARRYGLTAYDATYLELALRTGRTLATFDRKLADAVREAGGRVFGDAA